MSDPRVDILFALDYDPDVRVQRTSQALAAAGYDVRILAWDRSGKRPMREHEGPVEIVRAGVRSRFGRGLSQVAFVTPVLVRYLGLIRARRPDVLHVVDLPMLTAVLLMRPLLPGRPRIVFDAFEIWQLMMVNRVPRWVLWIARRLETRIPRRADLVLTPGFARQAWFEQRGVKSTVVANWIDPPTGVPDRAASRAELGIPDGSFCLVYTGGLLPARDLDALLDHAAANPADTVVIAGRGDQAGRIAGRAERLPNVRFTGWLPDPAPIYAAADAMYYALKPDHPYAAQAAPNNLYIAIAWAVPLVHRGQGEIGLLAERHEIGARFGEANTLGAAVDRLRDPAVNARVRQTLRELQKDYRWSRARDELLGAYRALGVDPPPSR